jgi:hypothetical protein
VPGFEAMSSEDWESMMDRIELYNPEQNEMAAYITGKLENAKANEVTKVPFILVIESLCYSALLQHFTTALCYSTLLQRFATMLCYNALLQCFATTLCFKALLQRDALLQCFASTFCFNALLQRFAVTPRYNAL